MRFYTKFIWPGVPRNLWAAIPSKLHNLRVGWSVKHVKRRTGNGGYWIWRAPNGDHCRSIPEALKHALAKPQEHCAIKLEGALRFQSGPVNLLHIHFLQKMYVQEELELQGFCFATQRKSSNFIRNKVHHKECFHRHSNGFLSFRTDIRTSECNEKRATATFSSPYTPLLTICNLHVAARLFVSLSTLQIGRRLSRLDTGSVSHQGQAWYK